VIDPVFTYLTYLGGSSVDYIGVEGKKVKRMPLSGQTATQFMHRWHSDLRHWAPGMGSSPPWQWSRQRLQSSQWLGCFSRPKMAQREARPSSPPSGQTARHQKRVMRKFAARIRKN